ncbi:LOW QUALITY PROTEIN: reverse transcriptase [Phytophthora megakarya]|uniref:Reverse transcriptase n=1 Tax=Phytophthora megakarya TaxID=4795 RepID=A0A225VWP1_9STRA|nr:LOW QUALITY PROTEIN: reverse transcriptase [Phytophthora megakarya]
MDLSYTSAVGQQKNKGSNVRCFRCGIMGHYPRECTAPRYWVSSQSNKKRKGPIGAGRPTGNTVYACQQRTRGMETAAPGSHCKVQDDKSILVILKMTSMTKRADSLRVLADSDVSNNLFDSNVCRCWTSRRSMCLELEVRLATGAIVKIEKRVIHAHFSYKHRNLLDLDDKFDMVLGMPWLARHDPTIDWEKRTVVCFGRRGATESDGPVSAADIPIGASKPPSETVVRVAVSSLSARNARAVTTPGAVNRKGVSGQGPKTTKKFSAVRRRGDNSVSTPGVDTRSLLESRKFSAVRRWGENDVSTLEVATDYSAVRLGLHEAGRDQAGLDDACPRVQEPAGGRPQTGMSAGGRPQTGMSAGGIKEHSSMAGPGRNASESGIHKKKRRRKHKTLRKSRSGTEALQGMSAGQSQMPTVAVDTLNVLTRASTGYQYQKMELENQEDGVGEPSD